MMEDCVGKNTLRRYKPLQFRLHSRRSSGRRLLQTFLAERSHRTREAYLSDLKKLQVFVEMNSLERTIHLVTACSQAELNALATEYRAHMLARNLSPATINRRLAVLRSLVRRARLLGMTPCTLDVTNVKAEPYRNTRGPGRDGFERLLAALNTNASPKAVRDRAIIRLLFDLALRRGELVSLNHRHLNLNTAKLSVLGKGHRHRVELTLPSPTQAALSDWATLRGSAPGPLFTNFNPTSKGCRLTGRSIYRIIKRLGARVGIRVTPHGLRHAAITEALDLTGGDVRAVQRFSRHRDLRVLNIYDDSLRDMAGHVAELVACGRSNRHLKPAEQQGAS